MTSPIDPAAICRWCGRRYVDHYNAHMRLRSLGVVSCGLLSEGFVAVGEPAPAPLSSKRAIVERILAAWERAPEMRLGDLLLRAAPLSVGLAGDEELAERVENYVVRAARGKEQGR